METSRAIGEGKKVKLHYILRVQGEIIDSTKGGEPLLYLHGTESLMPALQKALINHVEGEHCNISIPPNEAYGPADEGAVAEIAKDTLPEGPLEIGNVISAESDDGTLIHAYIKEIRKDSVIIDFNHPLAGKTLDFEVDILEVI